MRWLLTFLIANPKLIGKIVALGMTGIMGLVGGHHLYHDHVFSHSDPYAQIVTQIVEDLTTISDNAAKNREELQKQDANNSPVD